MFRANRIRKNPIVKGVRTQIAAFKERPDLETDMVTSRVDFETMLAKSEEMQATYESLRRSALAVLEESRTLLYQLRERCSANLSVAAARYGVGSAEAILLGAKPRRSRRSKSAGDTGAIGTTV